MYMRLGFAVAIHVDPDVLLVDEVLAVGDEGFTHKCLDKFAEFRRRGKTILLVTHSLGLVERFCDEALWLDGGRAQAHGDPRRVVDAYLTAVEKGEEALLATTTAKAVAAVSAREPPSRRAGSRASRRRAQPDGELHDMFQAVEGRWGSREVEITDVTLLDRARPAVVRLPLRRPDVGAADGRRARAGDRLRVRRQPVQRRRRLLLRHEHLSSRRWIRERLEGDVEVDVRDREPRSRRRHLQARRRRPQARRLSRTTTTGCSTPSA